jgi:L-alanine-DL-glutamate epimerase-like enolase superfamily enzyme
MLAEYDIYWLEEPLHPDDLDGYGQLCDRSPVRIAAGEECATVHEFRDLVERGHLDVLQPDVARVGGITEAMRIAAFAYAHRKPVVPHMYSTGVLYAASVTSTPASRTCSSRRRSRRARGRSSTPGWSTRPRRSTPTAASVIPTGPGLGIELDEAVVDAYRVA